MLPDKKMGRHTKAKTGRERYGQIGQIDNHVVG